MIYNIEKIHPVKREKIKKGCDFVEQINTCPPALQKMVIFGSSVSKFCSENSDIDICLFTDSNSSNPVFFQIFGGLPLVMDDLCDIVIYNQLSGKIKQEIDEKGVIVYEYQPN